MVENSGQSPTAPLGRVLVTGGSGFVGANLVTTLLDRGYHVRSFDRAPSPLPAQPGLEVLHGDICDHDIVAGAVDGIDTVFHTAALIELMGGASATAEYRQRSFAVNVEGTKNLVHAAQRAGVKRFVYTSSNSVVMGGQRIAGGDETLPYTERFNDLYTETKVVAERFVLSRTGLTACLPARYARVGSGDAAIRPCSAKCSNPCWPATSRCWSDARPPAWITLTCTT